MPDLTDRRVQKTRQALQKAFLELIVEKDFESITVQDILDKANVGRSTFYAHYQDKGELLHSCFNSFHKVMEQHAFRMSEGSGKLSSADLNTDFILDILTFAEQNHQLFKALLKQQDISETVKKSLFDNFHDSFKRMTAGKKNSTIPSEVVTEYFINALFGTFKWWVSNDMPYPAKAMSRYLGQLTMPVFKSLIDDEAAEQLRCGIKEVKEGKTILWKEAKAKLDV